MFLNGKDMKISATPSRAVALRQPYLIFINRSLPARGAEEDAVHEELVALAGDEGPYTGVVEAVEVVSAVGEELETGVVVVVGLTAGDFEAFPSAEDGLTIIVGDFHGTDTLFHGLGLRAVDHPRNLKIAPSVGVSDVGDCHIVNDGQVFVDDNRVLHLVVGDGHIDFLPVAPEGGKLGIDTERGAQIAFGGRGEGDDILVVGQGGFAVRFGQYSLTDDLFLNLEVLVFLARGEKACAADDGGGEHHEKFLHCGFFCYLISILLHVLMRSSIAAAHAASPGSW